MKCSPRHFLTTFLLALALVGVESASAAEAKPKAADAAAEKVDPAKPKRDWYPFVGVVASIDKQAKTISLKRKEGERVIRTNAKSEIEVAGKAASLSEVKAGYYVHGKLHKDASGNEVITAAKFDKEAPHHDKPGGDKPAEEPGQNKPKK